MTLHKPIKYLLMVLALLALMLWVTSCSQKYHLKRAAHHYERAIEKGFRAINDTIRSQAELHLRYNTDYLSQLKPRVLLKLDSFDISSEDKEKVVETLYREIEIASKSLELDTAINIDYKGDKIGEIKAKLKDGKLTIGHYIEYPQPIVYTQTFWETTGIKKWWLVTSFILVLAFISYRLLRRFYPFLP